MKKILCLAFSILALVLSAACANKTASDSATQKANENNNVGGTNMANQKVEISIKDYGVIQLELDPTAAPITVENFTKLVKEGFYNGLTFHRIISGFMIQGGDPKGDGTGGAKETIKGEFDSNGVPNPIKHVRGVISMARSMNPDSASSQFFIMHADAPHLDGDYAAFGHVTSGMEVVDKICEKVKVQDRNGTVLKEDQPIIEYIKIIE